MNGKQHVCTLLLFRTPEYAQKAKAQTDGENADSNANHAQSRHIVPAGLLRNFAAIDQQPWLFTQGNAKPPKGR